MGFLLLIISVVLWICSFAYKNEKSKPDGVSVLLFVLAALATIGWLWLGRSAMQWLWFGLLWKNITFWIWTFVLVMALVISLLTERNDLAYTCAIVWTLSLIAFGIWWPCLAKSYLYDSLQQSYAKIESLPETTQIRYLPMDVAQRLGANQFQDSRYHLGNIEPIIYEDDFTFIFPKVPTGFWNELLGNAKGFAVIRSNGKLEHLPDQEMRYGEGMIFSDDISWKLREAKYFADIPEIYYLLDEQKNEVLAVAPYISYTYRFPVMVPKWGGVLVVHGNGLIEDFTPEKAQSLPYVQGQRIFPEELALMYVDSWTYKNGLWNAWFQHNDQIEIPTILHSSNQMPYLIPTERGPKWFVATEPFGPAQGIFKIFLIDAHTGLLEVLDFGRESNLIGPNRAWEYAKAAFPEYKWGDSMTLLEPRPVMNEGKLYWMLSIVPVEGGMVTRTVLVDTETTDQTSDKIRALSFASKEALVNALNSDLPTIAVTQKDSQLKPTLPSTIDELLAEIEAFKKQLDIFYQKLRELQQPAK